jgi:hypothetical protein
MMTAPASYDLLTTLLGRTADLDQFEAAEAAVLPDPEQQFRTDRLETVNVEARGRARRGAAVQPRPTRRPRADAPHERQLNAARAPVERRASASSTLHKRRLNTARAPAQPQGG